MSLSRSIVFSLLLFVVVVLGGCGDTSVQESQDGSTGSALQHQAPSSGEAKREAERTNTSRRSPVSTRSRPPDPERAGRSTPGGTAQTASKEPTTAQENEHSPE